MSNQTDNKGFEIGAKGAAEWHEFLNSNFEDIDGFLEHIYKNSIGLEGDAIGSVFADKAETPLIESPGSDVNVDAILREQTDRIATRDWVNAQDFGTNGGSGGAAPFEGVAKLALDTDQSITADTLTEIEWDTEEIDTLDAADVENNKVTVNESGEYLIYAQARFNNPEPNDQLTLSLRIDGSGEAWSYEPSAAEDWSTIELTSVESLGAGQDITIEARNDSRADELSGAFANMTYMFVVHIGSTSPWGTINAETEGYKDDDSQDIADLFRAHPNATFILPEGDYYLQSSLDYIADANHDRLVVRGEPHARIVVDDTSVDEFGAFGSASSTGNFEHLELRNLTLVVDGENDLDAGWGRWNVDDLIIAQNLKIEGQRDYHDGGGDGGGGKYGVLANLRTEDGIGLYSNVDLPDGDTFYPEATLFDHAIGVASEPPHVGTNIWMGCSVEGWHDNGYYVKDGVGRNILIGCEARNCNAGCIRIGKSDAVIQCRAFIDDPDADQGVLLDMDEAENTTVLGFRGENKESNNPPIRIRQKSESVTVRDVWLENHKSVNSIRFSSDGPPEENGVVVLEGATVVDHADTSTQAASINVNRENVRLRDVRVECTDDNSGRGGIIVTGGSVICDSCKFDAGPGGNHAAIVGSSGGGSDISRAAFVRCKMDGGIWLYDQASNEIDVLEVVACEIDDNDIWSNEHPDDQSVGDIIARDNPGFDIMGVDDLSQHEGYFVGQVAADDGSNATGNDPALFVWDGSTWHSSNDEVTPS